MARPTVLVTGAAGFLGSHLAVEMAGAGCRVYGLARGRDGLDASGRFAELADYFRPQGIWPPPNLTVLEGDVEEPWLGLGELPARSLFRQLDQVIHCAARVDFAESCRERVMATNAEALERFDPLLAHTSCRATFNLVSTAYACGVTREPAREEPVPADRAFRNPYEESKARAEAFVLERLAPLGVPWRILRPSIVVGEAGSGRTRSFNAIYLLFELLDRLRASGADDPRLRIRCDPSSALNLVPVDWVVAAIRALVTRPDTTGGIFHLTQPRPLSNRRLAEVLRRLFPPLEPAVASEEELAADPPSRREELLARGLRIYRPYLHHHPRFDGRRAATALADTAADGEDPSCPPVSEDWLGRLLDYARAVDWGRPPACRASGCDPAQPGGRSPGHRHLERFFDQHLASFRGRLLLPGTRRVDAVFEVEVTDVPGLLRRVEIRGGELRRVSAPGGGETAPSPQCRYQLTAEVLREIAAARLDPREAFFARRTEIRGDMEAGLRVASLMVGFFRRHPYEAGDLARAAGG